MGTAAPAIGLGRIRQIAVNVRYLDRATSFYQDVLGLRLLFRVPTMSFFDCDGIRLMLGLPESKEFDHPASIIYYAIDDIRRTHSALVEKGVEFLGEPHVVAKLDEVEIWMAFFRDTEGNIAALTSETRPRA